jgi:hypothetical protein
MVRGAASENVVDELDVGFILPDVKREASY